jgi:hypothetical protein
VQVGERLGIAERIGLGQDGGEQLQRAIGLRPEVFELGMGVGLQRLSFRALVDQPLGAALTVGRRQVEEGKAVAALVVGAVGAERGIALLVDQSRRRVGEARTGILVGGHALGLEEQRPAVAEALQHVV